MSVPSALAGCFAAVAGMRAEGRRRCLLGLLLATLGLVAAACGGSDGGGKTVDLATLPAEVAARYRFIEANQSVAAQVRCYCGCDRTLGHQNLRQCFLTGQSGVYDSHALGCQVCQDEARDVEKFLASGTDVATISAAIDQRYGPVGSPTAAP